MKKLLEYGAVVLVFFVVWRWVVAFIESIGTGNTVQSSNYYAPGYPYQPYGGIYPGAYVVYSSGGWQGGWSRRPRRGEPGGSLRW